MKYIILTKEADADATCWGMNASEDWALAFDQAGHGFRMRFGPPPEYQATSVKLLVVNMSRKAAWQDESFTPTMECVRSSLGQKPRIWVHFGGEKSGVLVSKGTSNLVALWLTLVNKHEGFRRFHQAFTKVHPECGPMPYSQSGKTDNDLWDPVFCSDTEGLTIAVKRAIENNSILDIDTWLTRLADAWKQARESFRLKDLVKAHTDEEAVRATQDLMPVFIYLDGLCYASNKAKDKLEEMAKVVREGVPEVLKAISLQATSSRAKEIVSRKNDLASVGTVDLAELVGKGREFCDWYRGFLKDVMPESTETGEPREARA